MSISTSSFEKRQIADLVASINAKRVLEIGSFKGKTTEVLSRSVGGDGLVVAIDPLRWASKPSHIWEWIDGIMHPRSFEKAFWRNVRRSGHDNVWLIQDLSTSEAVLQDDDPRLATFDLAFIDGEHTAPAVLADLQNWGTRVRPGGLVLFHDCIRRFPGVRQAVQSLQGDPRYRVSLPTKGSIAVVEVLADVPASEPAADPSSANGNGARQAARPTTTPHPTPALEPSRAGTRQTDSARTS